ncbi:MAG: PEP-CTERM sorting domain-containing protein [Pseudomonadota bacterium]
MLRNAFFGLFAALFVTSAAPSAQALSLNVDGGGILLGASGVDVNGVLYDVSFVDGNCIDLFDGCDEASDFDFSTEAAAEAAAQALLDQVFVDGPLGDFDSDPSLTFGCSDNSLCYATIPYALQQDIFFPFELGFAAELAGNEDVAFIFEGVQGSFGLATDDFDNVSSQNFARFTLTSNDDTTVIPIPATLPLMLLGLGALGFASRLKRG